MSQTVYKYPFDVDDEIAVVLPDRASVLHIDLDPAFPAGSGHLAVWALVDPGEQPVVPMRLRVAGTGHPVPNGIGAAGWRATVIDGPFVWHVFEVSS